MIPPTSARGYGDADAGHYDAMTRVYIKKITMGTLVRHAPHDDALISIAYDELGRRAQGYSKSLHRKA